MIYHCDIFFLHIYLIYYNIAISTGICCAEKRRKIFKKMTSVWFIRVINARFKGSKKIKKKDTQYPVPGINRKFNIKKLDLPGVFRYHVFTTYQWYVYWPLDPGIFYVIWHIKEIYQTTIDPELQGRNETEIRLIYVILL